MSTSSGSSAELSQAAVDSLDTHSMTRQKTATQTDHKSSEKKSAFKYSEIKSHTTVISLSLLLLVVFSLCLTDF